MRTQPGRPLQRWLMVCLLLVGLPAAASAQQERPAAGSAGGEAASRNDATVDRVGLLRDFGVTLAAQQAYRLPRREIRERLDGPFWRDYVDSISHLQQGFWDGDQPWTWNLVVHPVMGGLSYHQARTRGASKREEVMKTCAVLLVFALLAQQTAAAQAIERSLVSRAELDAVLLSAGIDGRCTWRRCVRYSTGRMCRAARLDSSMPLDFRAALPYWMTGRSSAWPGRVTPCVSSREAGSRTGFS